MADIGASGAVRSIAARPGPRLYLAALSLLAAVACFLPLADHPGYEFAELIALCAGLLGGIPGVAAARIELTRSRPQASRALISAWAFSLFALALPLALVLSNGLRRPACDVHSGLLLYALLPVPSALLASALGVLCGFLAPRRAWVLLGAVFAGTLWFALAPLLHGPQIFAFHHLGGFYPGPIYDEAISASRALWIFRGTTLLYALACAGLAQLIGPGSRQLGLLLTLVGGGSAALLSLNAETLHWKASTALLEEALGGRQETAHLTLHFPHEKSEAEVRLLAQDAEASVRGVLTFLGAGEPPHKIDVYLYRSAEEKRQLIGAAETSFTKPWLRQIHTNDAPAPHPILRHELAHALAADFAKGPWGVPGRLHRLVPDMAFIEGFAVAADWPPGEATVHEEARALRDLGRAPDLIQLFGPGLFYAEPGARAYTVAGSFVRFLWETRGASALREAYAAPEGLARLGALPVLAADYSKFLDGLAPNAHLTALAAQRFSAPAIVRKRCAHEVAGLLQEAAQTPDRARAAQLWSRCAALEPDDPGLLAQLARAQAASGDLPAARETQARALVHPKISQPLRAQLLTDSGDAAFRSGDLQTARAFYLEAQALAQSEPAERALEARLYALEDPRRFPALRKLFADSDSSPEVWLLLSDLNLAEPRSGLAAYLLAKQLQNRGAFAQSARYLQDALGRTLPGPLFTQEALRMRGLAAWHTGDLAAARAAFAQLGKDAPPGRALEAQRWLELLR